jgi:hypothetical protein
MPFIIAFFVLASISIIAFYSWRNHQAKLEMILKAGRVLSTTTQVNQLLSSCYLKFGDRTKAILLGHIHHSHLKVRNAYPSYPSIKSLILNYSDKLSLLKDPLPCHPTVKIKTLTVKTLSITVSEIRKVIKVIDFEFRRGAIDKNTAKEEVCWLKILSSSIQLDEQYRLGNVAIREGRLGSARSHFENVRKIGISLNGNSSSEYGDAFISMGLDVDGRLGEAKEAIEKIKCDQSVANKVEDKSPDEYDLIFDRKKVNWHM